MKKVNPHSSRPKISARHLVFFIFAATFFVCQDAYSACEMTCPAEIVVSNDFGKCGRYVNVPLPVTGPGCPSANNITNNSIFADSNIGVASGTYPIGTTGFTGLTYFINDLEGNIVSCSLKVTVEENNFPCQTVTIDESADHAIIGLSGHLIGTLGRSTNYIGVAGVGTNYIGVYGSGGGADFWSENGTYGGSSSIRWKNNIEPIADPLEKVSQIRGVMFDWDREHGGEHAVGFIAEEVGKVLPEIVFYEENGIDAKGMDYSKMTPLLVEAVNAMRKEYRDEISTLKQENKQLMERLQQIESLLEDNGSGKNK